MGLKVGEGDGHGVLERCLAAAAASDAANEMVDPSL